MSDTVLPLPHKHKTNSHQFELDHFLTSTAHTALSLLQSMRGAVPPPSPSIPLFKSAFVSADDFELENVNEPERIFEGWGSIEMVDREGDLIPVDAIAQVMDTYMERGGVITDSHSSRIVGKMLDWDLRKREDGKKGIWLKGLIYNHYPVDDAVWHAVKTGHYSGFSLGGDAFEKYFECNDEECYQKIPKMALYEWSVVRIPANPGANILAVNAMAKSLEKKMSWDECVAKMKEEYGADADDKVYGTCMKLKEEGKVEGHTKEFTENAQLFREYAQKKGVKRLLAVDVLSKCNICKSYVMDLLKAGLSQESAITLLQEQLDTVLTKNKEEKTMEKTIDGEEAIDKQAPPPAAQPPMQGPNDLNAKLDQIIKMLTAFFQAQGGAAAPAPQPPLPKTLKEDNPDSVKEPKEDEKEPEKGEDKKETMEKTVVIPPEELKALIADSLEKDFGIKKVYTPKPGIDVVHPADIKDDNAKDTTTVDLVKDITTGKIFDTTFTSGDRLHNAMARINTKRFKEEGRM